MKPLYNSTPPKTKHKTSQNTQGHAFHHDKQTGMKISLEVLGREVTFLMKKKLVDFNCRFDQSRITWEDS